MTSTETTKRWVLLRQLLILLPLALVFARSSSAQSVQHSSLSAAGNILVQGRITDRSTGLPIVGATVTLYGWDLVKVQTDGNGRYSITAEQFSSTGFAEFGVTATGYFAVQRAAIDIAGPFPMTLDRSLLPGGTVLKGTVTDASTNLPIANAVLYGWATNRNGFDSACGMYLCVTTDASGNYTVDSSEFAETAATAGISGQWMSISAAGYLRIALASLTAAPPYPSTQNFALTPAHSILLQGTITDRSTELPIPGATVTLYNWEFVQVQTDGNGRYSITVEQFPSMGYAEFGVTAPGYFAVQRAAIDIAGPFPMTLDRSLLPGGTVLKGTVTDASTNLPIANAVLYGWATNRYGFDGYLSVTTDASGNYTVDSSEFAETAATAGISGQWMSISAAGYLRIALASLTAAPPYPSTQNFALTPAHSILLQGTITDRSMGLPVPGATVTLYNWEFVQVQTDGNGRYSITVEQFPSMGYAEFGVTAPGYFAVQRAAIDIAGPFPMTLDRSLLPGGTVLTGRVMDASTNLPIANAVLDGWATNLYGFNSGCYLCVTTDALGNYAIDSSEFAETAATAGTNGYMNVSSEPGFLLVRAEFNASAPFPLINDVALPPTGVTKTVTVATLPSGLSIIVDGTSSAAPQTYAWAPNTVHTIATTSPQGTSGAQYIFNGWSDKGAISRSLAAPSSNTTLTANFMTQYLLTTSASPSSGGSITTGGFFNPNDSVPITATPAPGFRFTGFSGDISGTINPQTIVMNAPKNITATFALITFPDTLITSGPLASSNSANASFTFTSTEAGASFSCSLDAAPFTMCSSPRNYTRLAAGSHNFRVQATGGGLTDSTPASFDWTIDRTVPNTTITSGPPALMNNPFATFSFISSEAGGSFQCSVDGGPFAPCGSPFATSSLADGKHSFQVKAVDYAGNVDKSAAKFKTWTVDTTTPDTRITKAPANPTTSTTAAFKFASTEKKSTFQCNLDHAGFAACASAPTFAGLSTGAHHIDVQAIDAAGNVDPSPATFDWTIN